MILETTRLILRPWEDRDIAPYAALNADTEVMRYFPAVMTAEETTVQVSRFRARLDERGIGMSAVERKADGAFIGMAGIQHVDYLGVHFEPAVETGWRLARQFWGMGYAAEAATAAMAYGYETLGLGEIVAFTAVTNLRSQAVMQRLGMVRNPADDFMHPRVPEDHPIRPHVLYRKRRPG